MPRLHILQSIWAMDRLHSDGMEWSLDERFTMIRQAGFDGICTHFHTRSEVTPWIGAARDHGFVIEGQCFPTDIASLRPALDLAAEYGVHHLTVQADVRPYDVDSSVPILQGWHELGQAYGVNVLIETHRGMMTTDLWSTREMLDRLPTLPLLADLSHYVCGQETTLPVAPRNQEMIERVLRQAQGFHGRIASSGQVQVELGFPCHRPWVEQFLRWWEFGFRDWLDRAAHDASLTFTCELGPRPYAISGPDGNDLSDRWQDAMAMKAMIAELWGKIGGQAPSKTFAN